MVVQLFKAKESQHGGRGYGDCQFSWSIGQMTGPLNKYHLICNPPPFSLSLVLVFNTCKYNDKIWGKNIKRIRHSHKS